MANGLLAKNGIIVTGSIEVQSAVTASAFSGDGSGLVGVSDFPYTGSAAISGSLEIIGEITGSPSLNIHAPNQTTGIKIGNSTTTTVGNQSIAIGINATANTYDEISIGYNAGAKGSGNPSAAVYIGNNAGNGGAGNGLGQRIGVGHSTLSNNSGRYNIAIGDQAGRFGSGQANVMIGATSGYMMYGSNTVAIGQAAGNGSNGDGNIALGFASNGGDGDYNIALGYRAGNNSMSGEKNILIGYYAGNGFTDQSNKLIIANTSSHALITGDFVEETLAISGSLNVVGDTNVTGSIILQNNSANKIIFNNADFNYLNTRIKLSNYNTGISITSFDEVHLIGNNIGILGIKNAGGIPQIRLKSNAILGFNSANINGTPQINLNRLNSNTLRVGTGGQLGNHSGSLLLTNLTASGHISASTYYGDGSNLTGISSDPFPYTGSAVITGSNSLAGSYALKVTNTSGADILNVENDGNVGIGIDNPTEKLHVHDGIVHISDSSTNNYIDIEPNVNGTPRIRFFDAGQVDYQLSFSNGFLLNRGVEITNGRFELSTTNTHLSDGFLQLRGTDTYVNFVDLGAAHRGAIGFLDGDSNFIYTQGGSTLANGTEQFRIASSGNVGIGVTNPQTNLHVSGAVSASTYYGDGSNLTGISSDPFPYTGSAIISGSLEVTGSTHILAPNSLTNNYNFTIGTPQGKQFWAENDGNIKMGARGSTYVKWDFNAGNRVLELNNFTIKDNSVYDLRFQAGTSGKLVFTAPQGSNIFNNKIYLNTSQTDSNFPNNYLNIASFNSYVNHLQSYTAIKTNDSSYGGNSTPKGLPLHIYTGQNTTTGVYGHLILQSTPLGGKRGNVGIGLEDPQTELHVSGAVSASTYYGENIEISGSDVNFNNLPTSDPGVAGRLYQTGSDAIGATAGFQVVCISEG